MSRGLGDVYKRQVEGAERALKKIRKTRDNGEYEAAVRMLAALCR